MPVPSAAFVREKLGIDFSALKHACPKGVYVTPDPDRPLQWTGVLFVRKGPYANAVLRFRIVFPAAFPARPPAITFLSDVFHPLVNPLTTYTYSTRSPGDETVSAADEHRLHPGGLSLRHLYPDWFNGHIESVLVPGNRHGGEVEVKHGAVDRSVTSQAHPPCYPHVVEILQYLRVVFDTEAVLDSIPLDAAANSGAWHAWRSYRWRALGSRATSPRAHHPGETSETSSEGSTSPRQQPGGARRPGEWNWQGVWEDRVRKSIQSSISDPVLFGGDSSDLIDFLKMDAETLGQVLPYRLQTAAAE